MVVEQPKKKSGILSLSRGLDKPLGVSRQRNQMLDIHEGLDDIESFEDLENMDDGKGF